MNREPAEKRDSNSLQSQDLEQAVAFAREFLAGNVLWDDIKSSHTADVEDGIDYEEALRLALLDPDTNDFDVGVITAAEMLRAGARLPDWLASFAADVLQGKKKRPVTRGRDKYQNWKRDYELSRAVSEVARKFNLPKYTKNELSDKTTAAEVVSQAANVSLHAVTHAVRKFGDGIPGKKLPQDSQS